MHAVNEYVHQAASRPTPDALDPDICAGEDRAARTTRLFASLVGDRDVGVDDQVLDLIIETNMPVASSMARRYHGRGEAADDLEQCAYLGLIKAVRRFDPARQSDFLQFAVPTIRGELRRHFRDKAWTIRPPRGIQELVPAVRSVAEELSQRLQRAPTVAEVAEALGRDVADVGEALRASGCYRPMSLDEPVLPDGTPRHQLTPVIGSTDDPSERVVHRVLLGVVIGALTERDRRVLSLRCWAGMSQQEIAREIGVSQMQVSRILSRIRTRLARELEGSDTAGSRLAATA